MTSEPGRVVEEWFSTNSFGNYTDTRHKIQRGSKLYDLIWDFPEIEHLFIIEEQKLPELRL